ncbi:MAG: SDR family oxidoreductase [Defluviitoga tunisiensis]|jgi:3-oxoacyl-[acyl-carrier protein] reductase
MYAATKAAVEAFSKTVAREFGSKKIRSNCVAPGFMETEMSNSLTLEQKDRIYLRTSLKEETQIESVSNTVKFLLSDESYSITGQVIHVDSGTI